MGICSQGLPWKQIGVLSYKWLRSSSAMEREYKRREVVQAGWLAK